MKDRASIAAPAPSPDAPEPFPGTRRSRPASTQGLRGTGVGALALAIAASIASPAGAAETPPAPAPDPAPRYALVIQDTTPLRAGPRAVGAPLASLGQGELVELRGQRMDYLQIWDTARARGGFVRAQAVRPLELDAAAAPELLAVARFLRDRPGSEALGLGFVAAYLKAAPATSIDAEPFDAIGTMAERLAARMNAAARSAAHAPAPGPQEAALSAQIEVATSLGVHFDSIDSEGQVSLCYDAQAYRRVLAMSPTPLQAARATLALTRPDCVAPTMAPLQRWQLDQDRAALLERVDTAALAPYWRNRVRMRQAGVWAAIAFEDSRRLVVEGTVAGPSGLPAVTAAEVARAGKAALAALAAVDRSELADDDPSTYADSAILVGASRWAAEAPSPAMRQGLGIAVEPGQVGETCVQLVDARHPTAGSLPRRCTYGTVWPASAQANASDSALALAVQPAAGWRELWIFRKTAQGWTIQVLPPANEVSGIGYVEFAGWVPGTGEVLAAREVSDPQRARPARSTFEVLDPETLATRRQADSPSSLTPFYRWQDPAWKHATVSLR